MNLINLLPELISADVARAAGGSGCSFQVLSDIDTVDALEPVVQIAFQTLIDRRAGIQKMQVASGLVNESRIGINTISSFAGGSLKLGQCVKVT